MSVSLLFSVSLYHYPSLSPSLLMYDMGRNLQTCKSLLKALIPRPSCWKEKFQQQNQSAKVVKTL